jgi:hypothetical protein
MAFRLAADVVLVTHFAFIAFVVAGGILVVRLPGLAWVHLPAAAWGAYVEIAGRICPLTYLENRLRVRAGESGYSESFIEHYLLPVIYPGGLTRGMQLTLATIVIAINVGIYSYLLLRRRKRRNNEPRQSRTTDETDS